MSTKYSIQTGRIGTGESINPFSGGITDLQRAYGKDFTSKFPLVNEMALVWRLWKGSVSAMQEGPAYGQILRMTSEAVKDGKKLTPALQRQIAEDAKKLAGDMHRMGAHPWTKFVNAAVPFSTAMIQ